MEQPKDRLLEKLKGHRTFVFITYVTIFIALIMITITVRLFLLTDALFLDALADYTEVLWTFGLIVGLLITTFAGSKGATGLQSFAYQYGRYGARSQGGIGRGVPGGYVGATGERPGTEEIYRHRMGSNNDLDEEPDSIEGYGPL